MNIQEENAQRMIRSLPEPVQKELSQIPSQEWDNIQEIRLQFGKPAAITYLGKTIFLSQLVKIPCHLLTLKELEDSFASLCEYSVHTYLPQIQNGYITIQGGNRVGLGGTAVLKNGQVSSVQNITSLNIRLIRGIHTDITEIYQQIFSQGLCSVLIAGEPSSGKTTFLRELALLLSQKYRTAVVDERGEIIPKQFLPQGGCLDLLKGFPKAVGILQAVRTLSPQIVICDEVGSQQETEQLLEAIHCGVYFITSIHAGSIEDLKCRPQFQKLKSEQSVNKIIFLKGADFPAAVYKIYKIQENKLVEEWTC